MGMAKVRWIAVVGLLVLAIGGRGRAQDRDDWRHDRDHDSDRLLFNGLIADHTVATAGSWELHGVWTLERKARGTKADFNAALAMERGDFWFLTTNPVPDPNSVAARNPHTHHIGLTDGTIVALTNGFRVTGIPYLVTGNGSTPPFGTNSTITIDITGGNLVTYSNIAVTFGGDAAKHFGINPLAGVVSHVKKIDD